MKVYLCQVSPIVDLPEGYWRISFGIIIGLLGFVNTVVNIGALKNINTYHQQPTRCFRKPYIRLLKSLCIADLLTGIVMFIYTIQLFSKSLLRHCYLDFIRACIADIVIAASVLTLALISHVRYWNLIKPFNETSRTRLTKLLCGCWITPLISCILCNFMTGKEVFSAIRGLVLILVLIITCTYYILLLLFIKKRENIWNLKLPIMKRQNSKVVKTVMILLTTFYLLFIPTAILMIIRALKLTHDKEFIAKMYVLSITCCILNSIINPFAYYCNMNSLTYGGIFILRLLKKIKFG